jgi:predicted RNase H-like nuclease
LTRENTRDQAPRCLRAAEVRSDGQRLCETQVGQRYGRWKVSANTTNLHSPRLASVQFLRLAARSGWQYSDGSDGPPTGSRFVSETYPYATLVGAAELGYDTERPRYKRKPLRLPTAQWRAGRAATCDTLIERLGDADPPLLLQSHPVTKDLAERPSPVSDAANKHREDLIDALLCAWTASLWARHGLDRCQVLGLPATPTGDPAATMIVPARPEQRLQPLPESALSAANECVTSPPAHSASAAMADPGQPRPQLRPAARSGSGPRRSGAPAGRRRLYQSLVSLAQGVTIRSGPEPKSMTRAVSSSTPMTRPRPYLS